MSDHNLNEQNMSFVKMIIELAKSQGCQNFEIKFRPSYSQSGRGSEIRASWTRGRHNAEAQVLVESTIFDTFEV